MKEKSNKKYEPTFEEAVAWYDSLPCDTKKIIQNHLSVYHVNSNTYVNYKKIEDILDWLDFSLKQSLKKNKIKFSDKDKALLLKLNCGLYPMKDVGELKKEIFVDNKTVAFKIKHLAPKEIQSSRLFTGENVYVKKVETPRQTLISVSNLKNDKTACCKTYYLDPKTFETQLINRYDNTNQMIDVDNNVGSFLTKYFNELFNSKVWRYAFTPTQDSAKLHVLRSIIGDNEKQTDSNLKK